MRNTFSFAMLFTIALVVAQQLQTMTFTSVGLVSAAACGSSISCWKDYCAKQNHGLAYTQDSGGANKKYLPECSKGSGDEAARYDNGQFVSTTPTSGGTNNGAPSWAWAAGMGDGWSSYAYQGGNFPGLTPLSAGINSAYSSDNNSSSAATGGVNNYPSWVPWANVSIYDSNSGGGTNDNSSGSSAGSSASGGTDSGGSNGGETWWEKTLREQRRLQPPSSNGGDAGNSVPSSPTYRAPSSGFQPSTAGQQCGAACTTHFGL